MGLDLNIMVGGEAGQGIQTIGFILGKTFSRGGLQVFTDQDYESRVRGGHNFLRVRVKDSENLSQSEELDVLVALNKESVVRHRQELKQGGLIIAEGYVPALDEPPPPLLDVPLEKIALETTGGKIMSNSVAAGAVLGLLGFEFQLLEEVLRWHFAKNTVKVQDDNVRAARGGYDYTAPRIPAFFKPRCRPVAAKTCMFLSGNEAISLGIMAAGCKFVAGYPMTPTTPILEYLADKGRSYNIAVVQPEDEIAAINMVIGASYAGVRAITATSGSGFALMVEGLGLSGIAEIPAVVVLGERPGPAVGLPTRTEQGELLFAIRVGTGEFPRVVLAPSTIEEAFYLTARAFNLAERYQVPVIILTDTHLANCYGSVDKFDLDRVTIERGAMAEENGAAEGYRRYALSGSGISPRAFPGLSRALVVSDADEHDESGHLTESADFRNQQVSKRLGKYAGLKQEISPPVYRQRPGATLTLIGWGSTCGAIREASARLAERGIASNILHFSEIWPFPAEPVSAALKNTAQNVVIESNATGQLAELIQAETGYRQLKRINKWDGRPISARYILDNLNRGEAL
jgi:2-oxoglutarate/2-oxoacid ferredoxin oxidoreductase subunit alpha